MSRTIGAQTDSSRAAPTTPERILESARILFQEKGYERTSMNDVAGRVGIAAPSVYWHFKSKEVILYSILRAQITDFVAEIQRGVEAAGSGDRLRALADSYVRYQLERLDRARGFSQIYGLAQLSHALTEEHLEDLHDTERSIVRLIESILVDGQRSGLYRFDDLSVTAFAVITMCENVTAWAKPDGRLSPDQIAAHLSELVVRMVGV